MNTGAEFVWPAAADGRISVWVRPARILLLLALLAGPASATPEYPRMGPDIFDPRVDGEELVTAALGRARETDRRVLLLFGANWCPWCRRLHAIMSADRRIRATLAARYILVHVDANTRRDQRRNAALIARYDNPLRFGLPVFVVLDPHGKLLATQDTQSFAAPEDREVADRLHRFLAGN